MLLDGGGAAPRGLLLLQVPLQRLRDPHLRLVVDLREGRDVKTLIVG